VLRRPTITYRDAAADRQRFRKFTSISTLRRLRSQPAGEQPPADLDIDTEHSDSSTSAAAPSSRPLPKSTSLI
jgi:hypothetical protein